MLLEDTCLFVPSAWDFRILSCTVFFQINALGIYKFLTILGGRLLERDVNKRGAFI